ncbi:MAG: toxin [Candidatus Omnitrophota bacterium]
MNIYYNWDNDKNKLLKNDRGICFEEIVSCIEKGYLIDIIHHPNKNKYPNQNILIVNVNNYAYLVPFVAEKGDTYFLKTIIPSREATKKYIRGEK